MEVLNDAKSFSFTIRDVSLRRLYGTLFVYIALYDEYSFEIRRKPKFYELTFHAGGN